MFHYWCVLVIAIIASIIPASVCNEGDELLKVLELAKCPFQIEPIGCYKDVYGYHKRALPEEILNGRDVNNPVYQGPSIQWKNYHHWTANFICECAKRLFGNNPTKKIDYIGLQFFGECWVNQDKYLPSKYNRYGKSDACIDTSYKDIAKNNPNGCGLYMGKQLTNYVYKVSRYYRTCPEMKGHFQSAVGNVTIDVNGIKVTSEWEEGSLDKKMFGELSDGCKGEIKFNCTAYKSVYDPETCTLKLKGGPTFTKSNCKQNIPCPHFTSRGCWNDPFPRSPPAKRPMNTYAMNERDPSIANWNGILIKWKRWGKEYLPNLVCRCAKIAKRTNKKFFAIQFYGECWTSNNEDFMKYGNVTRCMDRYFETCPTAPNTCRTHVCAGEWEANKVYEITQGPFKCLSNPCQNDGECITDGPNEYKCKCKDGYAGTTCENQLPKIPTI